MIKVSVIIPVYNGEKHLRQCMDSICGQTLKDIEIICVDDGSTDASLQILRDYQKKDPRVQIYTQNHRYAGAARNLAKTYATGEYLAFWDCDDFFDVSALELMYKQSKKTNADLCVCGANKWHEDKQRLAPDVVSYLNMQYVPGEVFNRETNAQYLFNFTNAVPWNKLYRRSFIEANDLDFQTVRNGNDVYFTQCAIGLADRITVVDRPLINYRINQGTSLVDTVAKSPLTAFLAWIAVAETLEKSIVIPEQSFANRTVDSAVYILRNIKRAQAFAETFEFLRSGALEKLHIKDREPEFYYKHWHYEFSQHLLHDDLENFKQYLLNLTYDQLMDMELRYNRSVTDLRNARAYRYGNALLWLPRKIKQLLMKH